MEIKKVEKKHDKELEGVIRSCLIEYSLNIPGTAWEDPYLDRFSEYYAETDKREYYVIVEDNKVVGGCGFGELEGETCELQKMYIDKNYRGRGYASLILNRVEEEAKKHYKSIYLETAENMQGAIKFYTSKGYKRIKECVGDTGHNSCGVRMLKDL